MSILEDPLFLYNGLFLLFGHGVLWYVFEKQSHKSKRDALLMVLGVVALGFAVKKSNEMVHAPTNLYNIFQVSRYNSPLEIRSAWKVISRKLHPDKNPSANAEEEFGRAKSAYDILMDEQQRDIYNRFGEGSVAFDPRQDELKLIGSMAAVYLFWIIVSYLMTMPKAARACRTWLAIIGIAMLVLEVMLCLTESTIPSFFPGSMTEHELIVECHNFMPVLIVVFRSLAEYCYVDMDVTTMDVLTAIIRQYEAINTMLDDSISSLSSDNEADTEKKLVSMKLQMDKSFEEAKGQIDVLKNSSVDPAAGYYWLVIVAMYGGMYLASGGEA
jgi:hypothetical protein